VKNQLGVVLFVGLKLGGWKAWKLESSMFFGIPASQLSGFPASNLIKPSLNSSIEYQITINA
jgi:predicted small integral membrane protein